MTLPVTALALCFSATATALLAGIRPRVGRDGRTAVDATALAMLGAGGVVAAVSLVTGHVHDRIVVPASGWLGLGAIALRADTVALAVVSTVYAIAAVAIRYTATQLRDDRRSSRLLGAMGVASTAAIMLATSAHLALTGIAFVLASAGLTTMLTHHDDQAAAHAAARRKFWVSRAGDVALAAAVLALARTYGTYDLDAILAEVANADAGGRTPPTLASVGLVVAVICKSALFPMHGWLPDTLEAPTGVSALMHAGLVNAGCLLLVRCEPIVASSFAASAVLVVASVASIAVGGLAALAQTDVKRALAWSTVGQMGFTALEVALGAPTLALLHTLGHAVYKAHAFLASGALAEGVRPTTSWPTPRVAVMRGIGITVGAALVGGVAAHLLGAAEGHGGVAMGAVMAVAVATAIPLAPRSRAELSTSLAVAVVFGLVWALVAEGFHHGFASALAPTVALEARGTVGALLAGLVVTTLVATSALARFAPACIARGQLTALHVAARHGFYAGAFTVRRRSGREVRTVSEATPTSERTP